MQAVKSSMTCYSFRVKPGEELKSALLGFVKHNNLKAPFILTCVGSVTKATLRMARGPKGEETQKFEDFYEILSLVGNLSGERGHLHISLGDKEGHVIGGHVVGDLIVYTTAEVVIGECDQAVYTREPADTGFPELVVRERIST